MKSTKSTLQESGLIVSLNVSQWTARRYDKKITDEVNTQHAATNDAGRYNKLLVSKEHLEAINKVATKARTFLYDNTLPWGDNGERLLSIKGYFKFLEEMTQMQSEFEDAIKGFFANYSRVIEEARIRLNGMFNPNDYPSHAEIEDKFSFRVKFMPIPSNDIRINMNEQEVERLRGSIEGEINARLGEAIQDIWNRIREMVGHLRDKLSDNKAIFRDSLFGNLQELVELLPSLNITSDQNIEAACKDMSRLMADPENVRQNPILRATKAEEADAVLNKYKEFFS